MAPIPAAREQLIQAVRIGDDKRVVLLASSKRAELGDLDKDICSLGLPILHAACAQDLGEGVAALVEVGVCDLMCCDGSKQTRGAHLEARLMSDGPRARAGDTPLHVCARSNAGAAAKALVRWILCLHYRSRVTTDSIGGGRLGKGR